MGFLDRAVLIENLRRTDGTQGIYIVVYCSAVKANYEYGDVHVITLKSMYMFRGSAVDLCGQQRCRSARASAQHD